VTADPLQQALAMGREHHRSGRLQQAEAIYRRIVEQAPGCAEGWRLLGLVANESGRREAALAHVQKACALEPANAVLHNSLGIVRQGLGDWKGAAEQFAEAIRLAPEYAEAHQNRGASLNALNRPAEAAECFREAIRLNRQLFPARLNLAQTLLRLGRLEETAATLSEAVRLQPGSGEAHSLHGKVLKRLGRREEAEQAFLQAIRCAPTDAKPHLSLGSLLEEQGRRDEALVSYQSAVRVSPNSVEAGRALGKLLAELGRSREAVDALRQAADHSQNDVQVLNELGHLLLELSQFAEGEKVFRQVLTVDPTFAPGHCNLAHLLADQGCMEESRRHYEEAWRLQPSPRLRVVADTTLPPLYQSAQEIGEARQRLESNLRRLTHEGLRIDPTREIMPTLFYLAYQGKNDRDLQAALAGLVGEARTVHQPARTGGKRIHVGFLSRNFKNHTIGNLNHGLIARLDRARFQVAVLSVGRYDDDMGTRIRTSADRFVVVPASLPAALAVVAAQGLDILFYTDVGMDPFTYTLALTRLAPIQCVTWGHPITTGMPSMDYFISSADLDTDDARDHYTERLVRLPTLGVFYERPTLTGPAPARSQFNLPQQAHWYACPQTLFKIHPDFDELLGGILRRDPHGILVLIEGRYPNWQRLLAQRFERTLADVHQRIHFVPRLGRAGFLQLLAISDVVLDPIHFGGGNSSYEALALGIPIVTLPSAFLRGRITYAQYRKMGIMDCVAATSEDYVRLALELGTDPVRRQGLAGRLREASGVLFEDQEAVRELERFFEQAMEEKKT
jgi:predicted O-linked N-acetylglucosamine transferase (SPINDLY family)